MLEKKRFQFDVILGIFVFVGLILLITFIFLIGRERRMFDTTATVQAQFPNVAGLNVGADVLLAGVTIGYVSEISFPSLKSDVPALLRDVTITMRVSKKTLPWIREDSLARIDSKGLLGDKNINITIGSPVLPQIPDGGMLNSSPPVDFNKALQQAQEILENVTKTVVDARKFIEGFVAEGGDSSLAKAVRSFQNMMNEVEKGQGIVHELIYDKKAGQSTKQIIEDLRTTLAKLDKVSQHLEHTLGTIKDGDGLLHAMVYDPVGKETLGSFKNTLDNMSAFTTSIKDGKGILHDLIYEGTEAQFLASLNKAALDLQQMVAQIKAGQGTIGRLLVDPSIYEELVSLLGNLQRNKLLKAVIRYNINKSEKGSQSE